jgi:flagellar basal-body rod protein FlgC
MSSISSVAGPVDIAVSAMRAHAQSMEVISSNIANSRTADAGQGKPYQRLETILHSEGEGVNGITSVEVVPDRSASQRVYDPGNPAADASGYVTLPNVQLPVEMMNLNIASRAYQASAAVLRRYQRMVEAALELLR